MPAGTSSFRGVRYASLSDRAVDFTDNPYAKHDDGVVCVNLAFALEACAPRQGVPSRSRDTPLNPMPDRQ